MKDGKDHFNFLNTFFEKKTLFFSVAVKNNKL